MSRLRSATTVVAVVVSVLAAACAGAPAPGPAAGPGEAAAPGPTVAPAPPEQPTPDAPVTTSEPGTDDSDAPKVIETITVAGDSISVGLGREIARLVRDGVTVDVIGVQGSGLAFPNGLDWVTMAEEIAAGAAPDVFVFSVGTNDFVDLVDRSGAVVARRSDPRWAREYSARLAAVFDAFADTGTQVWWVGHVCVARETICEANRDIHALATDVAQTRPWVRVEDLAALLGSGEVVAASCLAADGIHLDDDCLRDAAATLLAPVAARTP